MSCQLPKPLGKSDRGVLLAVHMLNCAMACSRRTHIQQIGKCLSSGRTLNMGPSLNIPQTNHGFCTKPADLLVTLGHVDVLLASPRNAVIRAASRAALRPEEGGKRCICMADLRCSD